MNSGELFPDKSDIKPVIYAYELVGVESHRGYIKVGETTRSAAERIREQTHTVAVQFRVLGTWSALRDDGTVFRDHDVRAVLLRHGFAQLNEGEDRNEWYRCSLGDVKAAVLGIQAGIENVEERTQNFKLREEQERAIENTLAYYKSAKKDRKGKTPKFLWNAKMRFGKTFAAYKLAERMGAKRVLILTFKPAVSSAWREDLMTHIDFEGWQFVGRGERAGDPSIDEQYQKANKKKPIVCFGSFQDFLGLENGAIKEKNAWVHEINWDLVIFDEYHFGAWRDSAKHLFAMDDDEYEEDTKAAESGNAIDESWLPITTDHYLFLSGTPFRALNSGEFIEEQIFNWTYADEQRAKEEWKGPDNPYAALPKMVNAHLQDTGEHTGHREAGRVRRVRPERFLLREGRGGGREVRLRGLRAEVAEPHTRLVSRDRRRGAEARRGEAADAFFGRAPPQRPVAYALVFAERRVVPCDGESAEEEAERLLP